MSMFIPLSSQQSRLPQHIGTWLRLQLVRLNLPFELVHQLFGQSTAGRRTRLAILMAPIFAVCALEAKKHLLTANVTRAAGKFKFLGEAMLDHVTHAANWRARRSRWTRSVRNNDCCGGGKGRRHHVRRIAHRLNKTGAWQWSWD